MPLKSIFLLVYYFGGTAALFVGSFMAGGLPYFLIAVGIWAISTVIADRALPRGL